MTKTFIAAAAILALLAACDETMTTLPAAPSAAAGSSFQVTDPAIAGKMDSATRNGNVYTLAYYADVVGDGVVLGAADRICAPGHANPITAGSIVSVEQRGGRAYHIMSFTCT